MKQKYGFLGSFSFRILRNEFEILLKNPNLFEWIDSHVERGSPPATYLIMDELRKFAE
jgi:hypothetical protein